MHAARVLSIELPPGRLPYAPHARALQGGAQPTTNQSLNVNIVPKREKTPRELPLRISAASVNAAIALAARRHGRGHNKRELLRAIALFLSVAIPLAFVAVVDHYRNTVGRSQETGLLITN